MIQSDLSVLAFFRVIILKKTVLSRIHNCRSLFAVCLAASFGAAPAISGEYAVLSNGFRLHTERHEVRGGTVRLHANGGVTELPAETVVGFEAEEYSAPPPPPVSNSPDPSPPLGVELDPRAMVKEAAARSGLPRAFVESVAQVESAFRPNAVSAKGAIGVMQLMPETARALSVDPTDPAQNIDAGARLLRSLLLRYDGDVVKALSAYNAGSGAVDRYRGMPPYVETREYVNKVIRSYIKAGGR